MDRFNRTRPLAVGFIALGLVAGPYAARGATPAGQSSITCTNPYSGTSWEILVDFDHATVDANPASIRDDDIRWHDAKDGGNYTLDRKTGNLTVVVASSTGGYFLYDRCKL